MNLKDMDLTALDQAYEAGKITTDEEFLAWLEAKESNARKAHNNSDGYASDWFKSRMIAFQRVIEKFKQIKTP